MVKVGDKVYVDGYTSMAQQNAGVEKIKKIESQFDEKTGEKFDIYKVGGEWYDSRDGSCYSNKNSMYYIELMKNE
jgi:hypothetical protein